MIRIANTILEAIKEFNNNELKEILTRKEKAGELYDTRAYILARVYFERINKLLDEACILEKLSKKRIDVIDKERKYTININKNGIGFNRTNLTNCENVFSDEDNIQKILNNKEAIKEKLTKNGINLLDLYCSFMENKITQELLKLSKEKHIDYSNKSDKIDCKNNDIEYFDNLDISKVEYIDLNFNSFNFNMIDGKKHSYNRYDESERAILLQQIDKEVINYFDTIIKRLNEENDKTKDLFKEADILKQELELELAPYLVLGRI